MRIALCGPATPSMLQPYLSEPVSRVGYPFPLIPQLAEEYVRLGHQVTVISTSQEIDRREVYRGERMNLYLLPSRRRARDRARDLFAAEVKSVRDTIAENAFDVVHAHWTYEFALGALLAEPSKTIVTAHDAPLVILKHMPDAYRLARLILSAEVRRRVRNLTAISPYLSQQWRRHMRYRRPIPVIANPFSPGEFSPAEPPSQSREIAVLEVSDASRRKNVIRLVEAFQMARQQIPSAELRLVGPGLGPLDDFAEHVGRRGLSENVRFLGRLSHGEVRSEMLRATLFAHSSLEESHGLALVEAMYSGLPVIAGAASGATAWTLFGGRGGQLVDVRRPESICDAILNSTSTLGARSDSQLRELINARHNPRVIASQYVQLYEVVGCLPVHRPVGGPE